MLFKKTFSKESGFLQLFLRMLSPNCFPLLSPVRGVAQNTFSELSPEAFSGACFGESRADRFGVRRGAKHFLQTFSVNILRLSPAFSGLSPVSLSPVRGVAFAVGSGCFLRLSPAFSGLLSPNFLRFFFDGFFFK